MWCDSVMFVYFPRKGTVIAKQYIFGDKRIAVVMSEWHVNCYIPAGYWVYWRKWPKFFLTRNHLGRGRNLSDGLNRRPTWCWTDTDQIDISHWWFVPGSLYYCRPTHDRTLIVNGLAIGPCWCILQPTLFSKHNWLRTADFLRSW